jgi:lipid-A-disaccharide synthase
MRAIDPSLRLFGFGGPRLEQQHATLAGDYHGLAVTGLAEAVRVIPRAWRLYRTLVEMARVERPDVFVAIDFPDFNFRLGAAVKRLGVPVVYYISPQFWAWRPGRLQTMKRFVDRMLVIFPFEETLYRDAGVDVQFVGHPLVDLAAPSTSRAAFLTQLGLEAGAPTIALLPGSRRNELRAILPDLAAGAVRIADSLPGVQFVLARAPSLSDDLFRPLSAVFAGRRPPAVVEGRTDDVLAACDVVVTASGTATVQAALHERPMVIVYRLSPATYRLGKPLVKVETYGMANLIAGRTVVPELIQDAFTPEAVERETLRYFREPAYAADTRAALRDVRAKLGGPGASRRAAEAILAVAGRRG